MGLNLSEEYFIDAYIFNVFTGEGAQGNPAAAIKLSSWLPENELKILSLDLKQPVTSFFVDSEKGYEVRWFAGDTEINLCGHGSLAVAAAIFEMAPDHKSCIQLVSEFGTIVVHKCAGGYTMTMPSWQPEYNPTLLKYVKLLGLESVDTFSTRDLVVVLDNEQQVRSFKPDFDVIKGITDYHAVIVTAQKGNRGYVLRYFAPSIGIDEDIATGSAQCSLASYWSNQLSSNELEVSQLSAQGGYFQVSQNSNNSIELKVNLVLKQVVKLKEHDTL